MELDPNDYDVVKLLTKLKNSNGAYPPDLLTPRRQNYIRRVAEIGLGFGVAEGLKTTIQSGSKAGSLSTVTASGLIEAALVVAIVAEAGAAAYIYRDQIAEFIQSYTSQPQVAEITSAPETEFSPNLPNVIIEDPEDISATPSAVETPSETPSALTSAANNNQDNQNNPGNQAVSTPDPNDNNGNQYGLTPKPDRTKEPGGGGSDDNNDENNKEKGKDK
jgi:hypothetical protein